MPKYSADTTRHARGMPPPATYLSDQTTLYRVSARFYRVRYR